MKRQSTNASVNQQYYRCRNAKLITFVVVLTWFGNFILMVEAVTRQAPCSEEERIEEYIRRNHSWPIPEDQYVPNTLGWKRIMKRRLAQVQAIPVNNPQQKFTGFFETLGPAVTTPNFTQFGWGLTKGPSDLTQLVRNTVYQGLPNAEIEFNSVLAVEGPTPLFIEDWDLMDQVSEELQPILEAWVGMELVPSTTYGLRLYRNESSLLMHHDRTQTHVISCIYHVASSDDSEPWPIVLEDYEGNTNSVVLHPGDVLLYESAKVFHGRPTQFHGSWYTSVFCHFYPKYPDWTKTERIYDALYAIPTNWRDMIQIDDNPILQDTSEKISDLPAIEWVHTNVKEPECDDGWCNLKNAIQLEGPGKFGKVLTTNSIEQDLEFMFENKPKRERADSSVESEL